LGITINVKQVEMVRKKQLTKIIPISMEVDPTIKTLSLDLSHVHMPAHVPVINPPKTVPIRRTAPEQSYATRASTPVDWNNSQASLAELLKLLPETAICRGNKIA